MRRAIDWPAMTVARTEGDVTDEDGGVGEVGEEGRIEARFNGMV